MKRICSAWLIENSSEGNEKTNFVFPRYEREKIHAGIVHLGIGAFHRAHQAWYTEAVLNQQGGDWAIIGCSLRSANVKQQLADQDGLYTLVERGPEGEKFQVIGAVKQVVVGPENPLALLDVMADEKIKVVSLTVTEKGYCHDPATGNLNFQHPDIQFDLQNLNSPKTAIGYLVSALNRRRKAGIKPFTPLSCDNLPNNGTVLQNVIEQFSEKVDSDLALWIKSEVTFPNTMIDRIVPATTDADREVFAKQTGYRDEGMVVAEPFSQWVIEDNFCNDRPVWEKAGALLVDEVELFEKMKLRLLNGSHSLLAYCGYLSGKETISEVMQEPVLAKLVTCFMDREAGETLDVPKGFDAQNYKRELRERFSNPGLRHRTWQIAMDGSQKLPQRLLGSLRDQLKGQGHIDILCMAVAAWMRYVSAVDEEGKGIEVQDPFAAQLKSCHQQHKNDVEKIVHEILLIKEIFGDDLIGEARFVRGVTNFLKQYYEQGVLNTIKNYFESQTA